MQQQPTPSAAEQDRQIDTGIFGLLLDPNVQRPWSVREIELDIGDPLAVTDSLQRLHGYGLIHRCGEYVWISRAAIMANELRL